MSPKKFFYVMLGGLFLLVALVIAGALGGNVLLQKQSKKLVDLKAQNKVLDEQQVSLIQAKKDVEKYTQLDQITKSIVPQDKDQAKTIREITKIAADSGIELKAITFQTSTLGTAQPKSTQTQDSNSGSSPSTSTTTQSSVTQVKPVDGIPGVYALEVIIAPADKQYISYRSFLDFLERLESNRRTAHVNKISVTPVDGGGVTFSLTLNAYLKP